MLNHVRLSHVAHRRSVAVTYGLGFFLYFYYYYLFIRTAAGHFQTAGPFKNKLGKHNFLFIISIRIWKLAAHANGINRTVAVNLQTNLCIILYENRRATCLFSLPKSALRLKLITKTQRKTTNKIKIIRFMR